MSATATNFESANHDARVNPPRHFREGWVHVCNGLDPIRDGGMVPSILGMTGALAARDGEPVSIVSPTPSRLDGMPIPSGLTLHLPDQRADPAPPVDCDYDSDEGADQNTGYDHDERDDDETGHGGLRTATRRGSPRRLPQVPLPRAVSCSDLQDQMIMRCHRATAAKQSP